MKNIFLVLIVFTFFSACKNDTKTTEVVKANIEPTKEMVIKIDFKTNKVDEFKLMMNNVVIDEFQKKNIHIIEKVAPSSTTESIIAKFGENNISNNLNISFGSKELKEIDIESINISYGNKTVEIQGAKLKDFFSINKYLSKDSISGKLMSQKIEGKHYPSITLKRKVINSLTKE